ncbi:DNA polymerase III subunit alpha [Anatilimnocola floriformis]|uniref:DNA polymerase III subunit alpha n=1 Tax=Anatilimnocola floriformis TaxID=2948575 RepID=UPI0020C2258C|nr:DNA polymerase III subunit alpha [Anatilimnocola floriformis]
MSRSFVHLHCHSHYSLLDGASPIGKLVQRAKDHGMNALALTDHGNLHGALEFYNKAKAKGINPILGYEAYIAPGSRFEKKDAANSKEASYHLTLLAQNRVGFKNLIKLASHAMLEGFYYKPRIDKEILEAHSEGIICLSGCVSSEFSTAILRGGDGEEAFKKAMETAAWFHKLFGDRYFVEIMNNGVDIQRLQLEGAVEIAKRMGLPLVATSDAHYVDRDDAEAQDVMLCVNTGKFRTDSNRMKMENDSFYLRSPEEMYAHFPGLEDAVARSQEIANSVCIDLELGKRHFPVYALPEGRSTAEYLRELCITGLKDRYSDDPEMLKDDVLADVVIARLDRELDVINKLGFPNYFLIVWDFVREARDKGIPATARGSGVGALVCFALYLSHVCPIKYDLLFERFLDLNRKEAPDIDIDFCKERRGLIINYVKEKYGEANVAQIGTFGTLQARAAIKDVGRVLGLPMDRVNKITSLVPDVLHISLEEALEQSDELKQLSNSDPEVAEVLKLAQKIEGLARNIGTHAAAVVIADKPLTEYVPLGKVSGKNDIITQWSMGDVEAAGLLKMDFLGLRNLTILSKAEEIIRQTTGITINPYKFPLDDKATFALLQRGETKGIFQLESGGIRDLLQKMKPDHFRDIIATNALYRPGPLEGGMVRDYVEVKNGRQQANYIHPVCEKVLGETHGVMVYQEQVMRILNELGGIELASSYTCIKAISKKKEELIAKNKDQFLKGCGEKGLAKNEAEDFWNMIIKFAGYGFNKSHSTAYALIAYMTAYLKAHYPVEFMAALLCGDIEGRNFKTKDALVEHLEDCKRMNIEVVPPDVNSSDVEFTVGDGKIYFGLSAIKGCGGNAGEAIATARKKGGPFKDLFDFCERVDSSGASKGVIETLIKAGAFDCFKAKRSQLGAIIERAIQAGQSVASDRKSGQKSLFGAFGGDEEAKPAVTMPDIAELVPKEMAQAEKEVLGFYLSSHPLDEFRNKLAMYRSHTVTSAKTLPEKQEVILGGMLAALKYGNSKDPKPGMPSRWVMFDLEDVEGGVIRCTMWPSTFAEYGQLVAPDAILMARGRVDRRGGEEANLNIDELTTLTDIDERSTSGIEIRFDERQHGPETVKKAYEIIRGYPPTGEKPGVLKMQVITEDRTLVDLRVKNRLSITKELEARLQDLLGAGYLRLLKSPPKPSADRPKPRFQKAGAR